MASKGRFGPGRAERCGGYSTTHSSDATLNQYMFEGVRAAHEKKKKRKAAFSSWLEKYHPTNKRQEGRDGRK